jgi:20S proteasome alpha/beta subunit
MTVCIAAIAAKSKAIVLASDKAVTVGAQRPMQSDSSTRKILPIASSGWRTLIAGDPSFAQKVIRHARKDLPKEIKAESFSQMMDRMKLSYQEVRKQAIRDRVLEPLMLTEESVVARKHDLLPLPDIFVQMVADGIRRYNSGSTMLIAGFGPDGVPHIFSLGEPGDVTIHDLTGYWAIGIGDSAAIERLLWAEIRKGEALERVLYEVFDAKANAEIVQGVGYEWDAEVMVAAKPTKRVPSNIKRIIEKVFEENTGSPFERKRFPDNWKEKLIEFSKDALSTPPSQEAGTK